jgi:hypothetical protein
VLRPQPVFAGLQRRMHLEEPANGFPDLGYLSYAKFQRFLEVPECTEPAEQVTVGVPVHASVAVGAV